MVRGAFGVGVGIAVALAASNAPAQVSSNARPAECAATEGQKAGNVWERAKTPALRKYCDLVASGASKLAGSAIMAHEVVAIADEAERVSPGRSAPAVLRGRAYAKLGRWSEAYQELNKVRIRDPRVLEDAATLLAWGRVALRMGHLDEGRQAYRMLLPRAAALMLSDRGSAYVEAGFVEMSRGPEGLDEAISIFRQARREAQDTAQSVAIMGLALALDRLGARDESRAVLLERPLADPWPTIADARVRQILVPPVAESEADALAAVSLEGSDPTKAKQAWQKYADRPGPWSAHARARLGQLAGKRGAPR